MRTEPLISATVWVALTWWLILSAMAGAFATVEGHFNWFWVDYTTSRLTLLGVGILVGAALAVFLIQNYRRRRASILKGERRPIGETTLGPFPSAWRSANPVLIDPKTLLQDPALKMVSKLSKHQHVRHWLTNGGGGDLEPAQLMMLCNADPYKRAFLDVLSVYARRPDLPATTRAGFHGSVLRSVVLIDHALAVCDKALALVPDFIYQGLVSRPGRMPVLPPRDSHYMPDTFKEECPIGLIALTALAHDVGKIFTFVEESDGKVIEARGKHGPVGAKILTLIPSIQILGAHRLRTMTAVLAHYHACHTLPLDVDQKVGSLMIRDDQTVALMEIVIAADKAVCACESSASVALSDYESDVVDFGDADADLIWQSVFLAIMPAEGRKPINGGNHERLGFKFGDKVYLIEEALRGAVIDNMGNILPPGERGGVNTLTHAVLHQMHKRELLITNHDGKALDPGQALFTVTFRQPPEKIQKQGRRDPKTYKHMIIMPVRSKLYDFSDMQDCPMVPEIVAPALGKHRGRVIAETQEGGESFPEPEPAPTTDVDPPADVQSAPVEPSVPREKRKRQPKANKQDVSKPPRQGGQVELLAGLEDPALLEALAPSAPSKAKRRKYAVAKRPGDSQPGVADEASEAITADFDALEPPEIFGEILTTPMVDRDEAVAIEPTPTELRVHVPAIRQVLAQRHAAGEAGGPKVIHGQHEGRLSFMTRVDNMPGIYAALPWQSDSFQALIMTTAMPMRLTRNNAGHLILVVQDE